MRFLSSSVFYGNGPSWIWGFWFCFSLPPGCFPNFLTRPTPGGWGPVAGGLFSSRQRTPLPAMVMIHQPKGTEKVEALRKTLEERIKVCLVGAGTKTLGVLAPHGVQTEHLVSTRCTKKIKYQRYLVPKVPSTKKIKNFLQRFAPAFFGNLTNLSPKKPKMTF